MRTLQTPAWGEGVDGRGVNLQDLNQVSQIDFYGIISQLFMRIKTVMNVEVIYG
jgi:hypothetical protein